MAQVHMRKDAMVRNLREQMPYSNWFDGTFYTNTHSHPTPRDPTSSIPQIKVNKNWIEEKSRGSRHILDIAPFSLWDDNRHDYIRPSKEDIRWIFARYKATSVDFLPPFLVVTTTTPSLPEHNGKVSLTLGCAPVVFTSPTSSGQEFCPFKPQANANYLIDRDPGDPLISTYQAIPWTSPSRQNVVDVCGILNDVCSVHALNFIWPTLTVELATNNRTYAPESLPNKLGGWSVAYHQGGSFWKSTTPLAQQRQIAANSNPRGDTTNYLRIGDGVIGPGIRVEGRTRASSAGVRVRKGTQVRITVADHGFEDCTRIYHPDGDIGDPIASIHERYPDYDWALAELYPSITFSNSRVFECPEPTRLLRGCELSENEWFVCDGMTTGKIAMRYSGDRYIAGKSTNDVFIDVSALEPASVYFGVAPTGGAPDLREGICGAPIIHEQTGGIAGFFQFIDERGWCFAPQLDMLIKDGWDLY